MLNKANLAIAKLAVKDEEANPVLTGILVTPMETVVTDGHRLVRVTTTDADAGQFPNFDGFKAAAKWAPFILKRDDALAVCREIPTERGLWPIRHAAINEHNSTELATNDLSTKHLFKTEHIVGAYPDYEKVVPKAEEADFVVALNARLLMEMLKAVVDSTEIHRVELRVYKHKKDEDPKAIRLDARTTDEQHWVGVLMPMRLGSEEEKKD